MQIMVRRSVCQQTSRLSLLASARVKAARIQWDVCSEYMLRTAQEYIRTCRGAHQQHSGMNSQMTLGLLILYNGALVRDIHTIQELSDVLLLDVACHVYERC